MLALYYANLCIILTESPAHSIIFCQLQKIRLDRVKVRRLDVMFAAIAIEFDVVDVVRFSSFYCHAIAAE